MHRSGIINRILFLLILGALAAYRSIPAAGASPQSTWNPWKGPRQNGISSETAWDTEFLDKNLRYKWKADTGDGYSNVTITGGLLYTMGYRVIPNNPVRKNIIFCLDAASGKLVWEHPIEIYPGAWQLTRSTPVVNDGLVYSLTQDGNFLCNDGQSGALIWQKNIIKEFNALVPEWKFASSVLIEGDLAIASVCRSGLALNKKTGSLVWKSGVGRGSYATPVPYNCNGTRYLAIFGDGALYGVEALSGKIIWQYPWITQDAVAADPVVYGGKLFISSGYDKGCALLDVSTGKAETLWQNANMRAHVATPIIIGDYVYGIDGDPAKKTFLVCLDLKDGSLRWKSKALGAGNMTASNGYLIISGYKGSLTVAEANPFKYKEISSRKKLIRDNLCFTAPVLCGSALYLRGAMTDIVCIDISRSRTDQMNFFVRFMVALRSLLLKILSFFKGAL